jgi:hypothetical protein
MIIKELQDGLTAPYQETKLRPDQTTEEEDPNYLPTKSPILGSTWKQVSSSNRTRKTNICKRNPIKENNNFTQTNNRFSPLANLCTKLDDLSDFNMENDFPPLILTAHKKIFGPKKAIKFRQ